MAETPRGGPGHAWTFRVRFRKGAFGWRSGPAVTRVREAVREIRKAARKDPLLGAEGAVLFLERVSPALERVDSSSGAIGNAVNRAIEELVPVIARAPADPATREAWLERLFEAHAADAIPYIELLAEHWGELCASQHLASAWSDRLLPTTRMVLGADRASRGFFHGTPACLSALYHAERYEELVEVLQGEKFWHYRLWAVKALAALGRKVEAIRLAEASRGPWTSDLSVDRACEEILLGSGMAEEAYRRYGLRANRRGTYLATYRAVAGKYPDVEPRQLLSDLAESTPGEEGKWFAAAKDAGLYDEALALASRAPCDPRTLSRAARDLGDKQPTFAMEAGLLALHWLARGHGYEITTADVSEAVRRTLRAAERAGSREEITTRIREIAEREGADELVARTMRVLLRPSADAGRPEPSP